MASYRFALILIACALYSIGGIEARRIRDEANGEMPPCSSMLPERQAVQESLITTFGDPMDIGDDPMDLDGYKEDAVRDYEEPAPPPSLIPIPVTHEDKEPDQN